MSSLRLAPLEVSGARAWQHERGIEMSDPGRGGLRTASIGEATPEVVAPVRERVYRQLFDRESLAEYLRLSTDTIDRLVKAGKLPCIRIGHQVRFTLEDVEAFVERHRRCGSVTP